MTALRLSATLKTFPTDDSRYGNDVATFDIVLDDSAAWDIFLTAAQAARETVAKNETEVIKA